MSLDALSKRLAKIEERRRPQHSEPWGRIIVEEGETVEAVKARAIAAGELRLGQPFIAWIVVTPQPRAMHA